MVQQEKRSSNAASRDAELAEARKWEQEARTACETSDWARAIVCYRRALQLAPFASELREAFENALEQQIREKLRREKAGKAPAKRAAAVAEPDEDEDDFASAKPARSVRTRPTRDEGWGFTLPRQKTMLAAACLAAVLTMGGFFATAMATGWLRDKIETTGSSEVAAPAVPAALQAKLDMAATQLKAGRRDEAIKTYRDAAKAFPTESDTAVAPALADALEESGASNLKLKRYDSAIKALEEATDLQADKGLHWVNYGRALREYARSSSVTSSTRKKELLSKAEVAFNKALSLAPADSGALFGLAQVYDARSNRAKAMETYEKLVALAPESMEGKMAKDNLAQIKKR